MTSLGNSKEPIWIVGMFFSNSQSNQRVKCMNLMYGTGETDGSERESLSCASLASELGSFEPKGKADMEACVCNSSILLARWEVEAGDSPRRSWAR